MAPPVTAFAVHDPYEYLEGLGNYHRQAPLVLQAHTLTNLQTSLGSQC